MRRSPRLPDRVRRVADAADPVAEVLDAHRHGELIALRTSGTAGEARSVVRTTGSWFDSFPHVTGLLGLGPDSRVGLPGPLSATMNLFAAVHAANVGASVVRGPLPGLLGGLLGGAPVSHVVVTPAVLSRALAGGLDLGGVHALVAGDRLDPVLRAAALAAGAAAVSHYYGAAELSFVAWGSDADDLSPFPGVEVDCRGGEIWVRSRYVCERYDGPDGPMRRGPDGFVTVGDRGRVEGGRLAVHGRGEDRVVTAGVAVVVADVEEALRGPERTGVVVLGMPHPDLGQVLCGVVTDVRLGPAMRRRAADVLEPSHRPRRWFVAPALPLTDAGKLDRPRLVEMLSSGEGVARLPGATS